MVISLALERYLHARRIQFSVILEQIVLGMKTELCAQHGRGAGGKAVVFFLLSLLHFDWGRNFLGVYVSLLIALQRAIFEGSTTCDFRPLNNKAAVVGKIDGSLPRRELAE